MGKPQRWSYSTGDWGRSRVRAYEDHRSGIILLEYYEHAADGRRIRRRVSLGHRDRTRAKSQADAIALKHGALTPSARQETNLFMLFENYLVNQTPLKSAQTQQHDRNCVEMFLHLFGGSLRARDLSAREWNRFIACRRSGTIGPTGKPVGNRTIEYDLRFLVAVLNWATRTNLANGNPLLERNPLQGLRYPRSVPNRPVLSDAEYRQLLDAAPLVDWRFEAALILVNETGHRIGSVRVLRWSDIDHARAVIRWPAEFDKSRYEHATPLTNEAAAILDKCRHRACAIGGAWVLPSPADQHKPCSRHILRDWWRQGEALAGLSHVRGRMWHSLRRKFANELRATPLRDLCALGGWRDPQTVLRCYQQPSELSMRNALEARAAAYSCG